MKTWFKALPASRTIYPEVLKDRLKYIFWYAYTPYHPFLRDVLLALRMVRHEGRQDFLLGKIADDKTLEQFVSFLIGRGYGNHFVAWEDEGELVSLRYVKDFKYQYHLRIFEDGEVRGHYEYTPECHPFLHMREIGLENRSHHFLSLLDGWVRREESGAPLV